MTDLARPLAVAIEAALRGGALLRAEFHAGPRGSGHKAVIDRVVEDVLRRTLLDAFPDDGFQGEETAPETPQKRRYWCVDPNDGTTAFLKGDRACAVSIGLIEDGEPIVGVVYAPLHPDDRGDLIVAARGGPLLRNGAIVAREPLPETLEGRPIVSLARGAERLARANLESTHPARFLAVASLAYRIALAAVGEADVGLGLHGCQPWDIAGAHALIRAAGGDCYLPSGEPIRYPCADIPRVLAGAREAARALAARPWDIFRRKPEDERERFEAPARLAPSASIRNPGRLSRAQGTLLALLCGDSLGQLVEFLGPEQIAARHPNGVRALLDGGTWELTAGQPTDDGELALLLARSIVADGAPRHDTIVGAYREWVNGAFDVGNTTRRGIAGDPDPASQANGSLMRIAPLAIYGHALKPDALAALAREESARTHVHPVCRDACAVYCVAIAYAIATGEGPREVYEAATRWAARAALDANVRAWLRDAEHAAPSDFTEHLGWARIALQNAFHRLLHARSLEDGIVDTVHRGGDTDTNAAIVGALLGAVHGREGVPLQWRRAVLSCRPVSGLSPTRHPRPRVYWPVDALVLAERLLLAGERGRSEEDGRDPVQVGDQ